MGLTDTNARLGIKNHDSKNSREEDWMRRIPEGSILIYDIETTTHKTEEAKIRFFGYYSYSEKKTEIIEIKNQADIDRVKAIIDSHEYLVGFNNIKFDNVILERHGINFRRRNIVDMWDMLAPKSKGGRGRHAIIWKTNPPRNYKLATIVKMLGLGTKKNETFDYQLLQKTEPYTSKELSHIIDYTKEDILITRNLFEYVYNYFWDFKEYMNDWDQKTWKWLTASPGSYAYKVLCHQAGIREEYADADMAQKAYQGAYVSEPVKEKSVGTVWCIDLASAYPHAYMMANLYSHGCTCCHDDIKFRGREIFKLKGAYCVQSPGKIETVIKTFYRLRQEYKKIKDPRDYTLKIILNSLYGISGSPTFKSIYNLNTASDCTYIVREMIKYAREKMAAAGYGILYSDTDSIYLEDPFSDEKKLLKTKNEIIKYIRGCFPFPQDTFDMGVEAKLKAIFFFKTGNEFIKKNYMYVTSDDKLVIKGLPMIKSNASALSQFIFQKYLKPQIIARLDCKFNKDYIKQLLFEELGKDVTLAGQLYQIKPSNSYKVTTSLNAKVSRHIENLFSSGNIAEKPDTLILIPNDTIDLGRRLLPSERRSHRKGYCTVEDFKKHKLQLTSIDLGKTMSELNPFIKDQQTKLEV
ncbi:MAG: DNA polymerase domain-containing protein [bacterium]|nr:DNA polymerase domain-containing protein [bacterium]